MYVITKNGRVQTFTLQDNNVINYFTITKLKISMI